MSLGLIPQDVINRIRERIDIIDVVSGYVTLTKTGQNFKGLCPFHTEKTPSFTVSPARQIFHCFGCGAGGNVFTFLMKIEGSSFPDAVRELGRRVGIDVPAFSTEVRSADHRIRERLEQLHQAAAAWFQRNLRDVLIGRSAMAYLAERGIQPRTIEAFGLGFAPQAWDGLIRALSYEGYSLAELAASGLVSAKGQAAGRRIQEANGYYDRFRGRLMFPIRDLRKRVIGFGGRSISDGDPKYLNSPETPIFNKGHVLYGLDRAREAAQKGQLIIVEGYFDTIVLHQAGITNVVATLGTALTSEHLHLIRRFATKVVLLFDPDPAGVRASLRTLDLFVNSGIGVSVVSLPDGLDPDAFIRKRGAAAFVQLLEQAPSLLDFAIEHSLKGGASGSVEDRIRSVDEILHILQKTKHRLEKEEWMRRVAERLGVNQQRLIERYPELRGQDRPGVRSVVPVKKQNPTKRPPEEWDLVYLLLHGHLSAAQVRALKPVNFSVPACRRIVEIGLRHLDREGRVLIRPLLDEAMEDPECSSAVTELSMSERYFDDAPEYINGCLQTLERKRRNEMLGDLIAKLRAAELAGRTEEARLLNAQINELRMGKLDSPLPVS